jgi:succinate--hydroxymethylglutarate CoA-transferase
MKKESGKKVILDLATKSDILLENFLPGKLAELGLGYEDVRAVNPRIIYCSISGFGSSGPCV